MTTFHITACFYGGPATAYPVFFTVEGTSEFPFYRQVQGWSMEEWRTHFPEEVRSFIRDVKDIMIVNVESDEERQAREDLLRLQLEAEVAPPPPVSESKPKKKRLLKRK